MNVEKVAKALGAKIVGKISEGTPLLEVPKEIGALKGRNDALRHLSEEGQKGDEVQREVNPR